MKNLALLSILFLASNLAFSQVAPEKIQKDVLQVGRASSLLDKSLTFDTGDGASNKKLELDGTSKEFSLNSKLTVPDLDVNGSTTLNTLSVDGSSTHKSGLTLGDGTDSNKSITVDQGGSNPYLKWDATKNKWVFSNDSVIEKAIGSGGGGGTGQTFNENGNIEDGISVSHTFTSGVATAATGANALEGEGSVTLDFVAENDFYQSSYFTLPPGLYGMACEMRFKYTGGDANTYVAVETESAVTLGRYQRPESGAVVYGLPAHTESGYESVFFKCPTLADITADPLNGKIRYRLYQGTAVNAAPLTADLFSMGELIGLSETTLPDLITGTLQNVNGTYNFSNIPGVSFNVGKTGTGYGYIDYSSLGLSSAPQIFGSNKPNSVSTDIVQIEFSSITNTAATFAMRARATAGGASFLFDGTFIFSIVKQGVDAKQSVQVYKSIPKIAENINDFQGYVNSSLGIRQGATEWISSCVSSGTSNSIKTCNFVSGIFSNGIPLCVATGVGANAMINAVSLTQLIMQTYTVGGVPVDAGIDFSCQKEKSDFKMPSVQPIVIGQVTNSAAESALNNVRVESCPVINNGSATIGTHTGTCGWIQSVTRTGVGLVTINIVPGTFSSFPTCVGGASQTGDHNTIVQVVNESSIASDSFITTSGASVDRTFSIICLGKR